jgi:hypothetical protein
MSDEDARWASYFYVERDALDREALRNNEDIRDARELNRFERAETAFMHHHIFKNVHRLARQARTVNMGKADSDFLVSNGVEKAAWTPITPKNGVLIPYSTPKHNGDFLADPRSKPAAADQARAVAPRMGRGEHGVSRYRKPAILTSLGSSASSGRGDRSSRRPHRAPCSTRWPPSKCSTCTFQQQTDTP